jgi:hypothetical protein
LHLTMFLTYVFNTGYLQVSFLLIGFYTALFYLINVPEKV